MNHRQAEKVIAIWGKGIRYLSRPMFNGNGHYGLQQAGQQCPTCFLHRDYVVSIHWNQILD